ncbi:hypothetical protein [Leeuwenhoekiella marinoflava]|uniref:GyrI-like small molecule binding domain-containing protein n=2 Tax=Leeuwenhoekiella marinoflava TaxID=988 RepID=A0A4V1KSI2_9FLAO|nr:hypothetical protein [Leeuwenhoekiella marinoflava]RXG31828.1 hypothetical protein DSL99_1652 [Leeuwenhoekiella marinoflava]SHF03581.1 hypothetical protein SAMN02745246_01530 [Leeuwenhoekiella marinoflava DSM 3653]
MSALNLKDTYKSYYTASEQPEVVDILEATYISILGSGSPGTAVFYEKKKALLDFVEDLQQQYTGSDKAFISNIVEIFYWFDEAETGFVDIGNFYTTVDLDLLHYRIAIRTPEYISDKNIQETIHLSKTNPFANDFKLFKYTAGKSVQVLHLGPFAGELKTLPILQHFATEKGLKKSGMHHEIHLVNFESGQSQDHLKTILRDPVVKNKQ